MTHIDLELKSASLSIMTDGGADYADLTVKQRRGQIVCLLSYEHPESPLACALLQGITQAGYAITYQPRKTQDRRAFFVLAASSFGEGIETAKALFMRLFPDAYMQLWHYCRRPDPRLNAESVVRIEISHDPRVATIELNHSDYDTRKGLMPEYIRRLQSSGLCRPKAADADMGTVDVELTDEAAKDCLATFLTLVNLDPHLDV